MLVSNATVAKQKEVGGVSGLFCLISEVVKTVVARDLQFCQSIHWIAALQSPPCLCFFFNLCTIALTLSQDHHMHWSGSHNYCCTLKLAAVVVL